MGFSYSAENFLTAKHVVCVQSLVKSIICCKICFVEFIKLEISVSKYPLPPLKFVENVSIVTVIDPSCKRTFSLIDKMRVLYCFHF